MSDSRLFDLLSMLIVPPECSYCLQSQGSRTTAVAYSHSDRKQCHSDSPYSFLGSITSQTLPWLPEPTGDPIDDGSACLAFTPMQERAPPPFQEETLHQARRETRL